MNTQTGISFVKHVVKFHAALNIPLGYDEAYELGKMTVESLESNNGLGQIQTNALLTALHNRALYHWQQGDFQLDDTHISGPEEQVAGICAAVFECDVDRSDAGNFRPNVPFVVDNCGMGGDIVVTANVSSLAALTASACGVHMCKHGSPSNADQGQHGSSDFIALLGLDSSISPEAICHTVETVRFGYTEALDTRFKRIHLQTHEVAKMPHMNDIIGPITNPLHRKVHTKKVLGVNHLIPTHVVAGAYKILNERDITHMDHLICVRGFIGPTQQYGVDEVSVCQAGTIVSELFDGVISTYRIGADSFGIEPLRDDEVSPPKGMSKGTFSMSILFDGIDYPAIRMVLANAAIILRLSNPELSLRAAYALAEDAFRSGAVRHHFEKIKDAYQSACATRGSV